MAWRNRKTTGPLVMITERNGLAREGATGHVRSSGPAIAPVAHVTPEPGPAGSGNVPSQPGGPPPWPGSPAAPAAGSVEAAEAKEDVDFWDWAPEEPDLDKIADSAGAEAAEVTADASRSDRAASGPSVPAQATAAPVLASAYDDVERSEGIGFRFSSLSHIFGHSRMGMWRRRLAIAVVAFALLTVLTNWQAGVTLAIVAVIADVIIRARTTTPVPQVAGARKATKPQRMTQKQLVGLDKPGYRALHSRLIPDSDEHIDHLVVGPAGVFAIDSEWWDKNLPIRTKNARQLWLGPFSMKERLEHAHWEAAQASALLSGALGATVTVRPVMAVYGPKIPWDVTTIRDVDVFSGKRLRTYLRRYARQNTARPLTPAEINRILAAAHKAFPHLDPGIPAPPLPSAAAAPQG